MALTPASVRLDLKCGNGAISEGEKCHKGNAQKVDPKSKKAGYEPTFVDRLRSGWAGLNAGLSAVGAAQNLGLAIQHKSAGHAIGALGNLGGAALNLKASSEYKKGRAGSGFAYQLGAMGSNNVGLAVGSAVAESDFRRRQANAVAKKSNYSGSDPFKDLGLSKNASPSQVKAAYFRQAQQHHPDRGGDPAAFLRAKTAYEEILRRQGRGKGTRDSIWAEGFAA